MLNPYQLFKSHYRPTYNPKFSGETTLPKLATQAIIIGGSIAGLAAASALSPYVERVIVVERGPEPMTNDARKTVPQGAHAHALLKGGEKALESLFPGLVDDLIAHGAHRIDFSRDVRWFHAGAWKMRYQSNIEVMVQSRPLLEQVIRSRAHALGNVDFWYGYDVESLKLDSTGKRIQSVMLHRTDNHTTKIQVNTSLLIDASGRGSHLPQWLLELGYAAPQETRLKVDLSYSSRLYRAPQGKTFDWGGMIINAVTPKFLNGAYIFPIEDNQWLVTMAGYSGTPVARTNEAFIPSASTLAQPDIYEVLKDSGLEPISDVRLFNVPETVRRHYEATQMPEGVLVMGDAGCAFDPVFGQGMTVAALEAVALKAMLAGERPETLPTLGARFHKACAKIVSVPWFFSSTEDFRYPNTVGKRGPFLPLLHWYNQQIFELSAVDRDVYAAFGLVMQLLSAPALLFKPGIVFKVLRHGLFGRSSTKQARPITAEAQSQLG